jgi:aldose 1-epimerase
VRRGARHLGAGEVPVKRTQAVALSVVVTVLFAAQMTARQQARYTAKTMGDVVQLRDTKADTVVSVLTGVSNAYEMVVKGENVLRMPFQSVDDMRAQPGLNGIPLLAPFANRLDEQAFYANGRKYNFDMELGNVLGAIPIHGYLSGTTMWKLVEGKADASGAWVTSRLDFYRNPQYMKQFPFAHTLTMTYRLSDGALEVRTRIDNLSTEPMPVAIGFHPYFQLTDSLRSDWTLSVGARTHWLLAQTKIPTGETETTEQFFGGDPHAVSLSRFASQDIDDVFSDLERDPQGRASVRVKGVRQQLEVVLGPNFKAVLVYSTVPGGRAGSVGGRAGAAPLLPLSAKDTSPAPRMRGFVAIEPMAGITNAMNMAHKGTYTELQSIAPGSFWQESFWIKPGGY